MKTLLISDFLLEEPSWDETGINPPSDEILSTAWVNLRTFLSEAFAADLNGTFPQSFVIYYTEFVITPECKPLIICTVTSPNYEVTYFQLYYYPAGPVKMLAFTSDPGEDADTDDLPVAHSWASKNEFFAALRAEKISYFPN